jgi:hypothetical protein
MVRSYSSPIAVATLLIICMAICSATFLLPSHAAMIVTTTNNHQGHLSISTFSNTAQKADRIARHQSKVAGDSKGKTPSFPAVTKGLVKLPIGCEALFSRLLVVSSDVAARCVTSLEVPVAQA